MSWYEDAGEAEADYDGEMAGQRAHEAHLAFLDAFKAYAEHGPVEVDCCERKPLTLADSDAVYDSDWGLFYCNSDCFDEHRMHNFGGFDDGPEDFYADLGIHCSDPPEPLD